MHRPVEVVLLFGSASFVPHLVTCLSADRHRQAAVHAMVECTDWLRCDVTFEFPGESASKKVGARCRRAQQFKRMTNGERISRQRITKWASDADTFN
jgi:hypothetical protein